MNLSFSSFIALLWQEKPSVLILFTAVALVFVVLVLDTHRYRNKEKHRRRQENQHPFAPGDFLGQLYPCVKKFSPRAARANLEKLRKEIDPYEEAVAEVPAEG